MNDLYETCFITYCAWLLFLICCICMPGCIQKEQPVEEKTNSEVVEVVDGTKHMANITFYRLDGCEYISWFHGLTHKGDCDNPIHRISNGNK